MKSFGQLLRQYRLKSGFGVQVFSMMLGMKTRKLLDIEQGLLVPSAQLAETIALMLRLDDEKKAEMFASLGYNQVRRSSQG